MLGIQIDLFGADDVKCLMTVRKISMLQENKLTSVVTKQLDVAYEEMSKTNETVAAKSKTNKKVFSFFKTKKRVKNAPDP
jgi:hypothetical protein